MLHNFYILSGTSIPNKSKQVARTSLTTASLIRYSNRITPPSRVLNGLPSLPFIVPNRKVNLVVGGTKPAFLAHLNTCSKCSPCLLSRIYMISSGSNNLIRRQFKYLEQLQYGPEKFTDGAVHQFGPVGVGVVPGARDPSDRKAFLF